MQAEGLEEYIRCKLLNMQAAPDAAATSLALWLLKAVLSRTHDGPALATNINMLACPPPMISGSDEGTAAPERHFPGESPLHGTAEVTEFVFANQQYLPYSAVEQILLSSGCRRHLKEVARLFEAWQTVFNLSVASAMLMITSVASAAQPFT
jgi:hypothetical protein